VKVYAFGNFKSEKREIIDIFHRNHKKSIHRNHKTGAISKIMN